MPLRRLLGLIRFGDECVSRRRALRALTCCYECVIAVITQIGAALVGSGRVPRTV